MRKIISIILLWIGGLGIGVLLLGMLPYGEGSVIILNSSIVVIVIVLVFGLSIFTYGILKGMESR